MIRQLTKTIQDGFLRNGLFIGLITGASLVVLETYLELSNSAWSVPRSLMLLTGILLFILLWRDGENKSHKKSVPPGLAVPLWVGEGDFWETPCQHCGKLSIIQCRVEFPTSLIRQRYKLLKRSRTRR